MRSLTSSNAQLAGAAQDWDCIGCWAGAAAAWVVAAGYCYEVDDPACLAALAEAAYISKICGDMGCDGDFGGKCYDKPETSEDDCSNAGDSQNELLDPGGGWTVDGYWSPHDRPGGNCYRLMDGDSVCTGPDIDSGSEVPPEQLAPEQGPNAPPGDPRPPTELKL